MQPLDSIIELDEVQLNDHIDAKVSKERIAGMLRKMQTTEEKLKHLQKVKDRWGRADTIIKIIGVSLTFTFTFLTTILNVIPENSVASLPLITAILSALAAVSALTSEGTIIGFTSKNKAKFQNQIRELEKKYNQCYIFYEKARADQKITNEELMRFYSIYGDTKEV